MAAVIETGARVTRITRNGADKALSRSRDARPFALSVAQADGRPRRDLARAVIDALGVGTSDQLPARGELGVALKAVVDAGRVTLVTGFAVTTVSAAEGAVILRGATDDGERTVGPADRIIVATGQRPDLSMTRELRLDLDPDAQSTPQRRHSQQP